MLGGQSSSDQKALLGKIDLDEIEVEESKDSESMVNVDDFVEEKKDIAIKEIDEA